MTDSLLHEQREGSYSVEVMIALALSQYKR